ncbi:siroheme decarboxylase subunit beta [Desulfurispora thermophila]|uniref:siroheme decarboxylase subunit beta n=1 Tax=Desulfurispora thermophila TaxID=265470 RepID=UPI00035DB4A1|nr:AsnC family transcriptional regulator [Desulfurispora thermophila]
MLDQMDRQIVRLLQRGLPLVPRPYQVLADQLGISEQEMLERIERMLADGRMRRLGAALRHRELGFTANAMIVWRVPPERVDEVGQYFAACPEVTHCYLRRCPPGWPYNIFTVIHNTSRQACRELAARLAAATGLKDYQLVFSTHELKKSSMCYFEED